VRVFDPAPTQGATYHRGVDGRGRGRRRGLARGVGPASAGGRLRGRCGRGMPLGSAPGRLPAPRHGPRRSRPRRPEQGHRCVQLLSEHDLPTETFGERALRETEPTLSTRAAGGVLLPDDHQVNPRRVVDALWRASVTGWYQRARSRSPVAWSPARARHTRPRWRWRPPARRPRASGEVIRADDPGAVVGRLLTGGPARPL